MSVPISKLSQTQKVDVLFNKVLGKATDKNEAGFNSLPVASAAPKIIPSLQMFGQEIPAVAPILSTDPLLNDLLEDMTFAAKLTATALTGANAPKRYTSIKYPHIVKYENVQLKQAQEKESYTGIVKKSPNDGENLLAQTIPFNYDPANSYDIKVLLQLPNSTTFTALAPENPTAPWFYDKDAGYLTFYGTKTIREPYLSVPPLMTFWRYEGTFGLGAGGLGPTGAQGIKGEQGPAGPPGSGGGGGGAGEIANDTWLLTNLLGQPGAITFGTPVSKTTAIYVPWSYPSQIQAGWAAGQWLPNITKFTGAVTTVNSGVTGTSYPTTNVGSSTYDWIKDPNSSDTNKNKPATLLVINKNDTAAGRVTLTSDPTGPKGNTDIRYAYNWYDSALSNNLKTSSKNEFSAYYSNPGNVGPFGITNSSSVVLGGFSGAGPPGFVRSLAGPTNQLGFSMGTSWVAPIYADTDNTEDAALITSYDISYNTTGSIIRYGGPISQATNASSTVTSATLSSLCPDASYSIQVCAVNNSGITGPYITVPLTAYSGALAAPAPISTITFDSTTLSAVYPDQSNIRRVEGSSTLGSDKLFKGAKVGISSITVPVHRLANRGAAGSDTIMKISALLGTVEEPTVDYHGFSDTYVAPSGTSNNGDVVITTTNNVTDYYNNTEPANKQGFYLKANNVTVDIVAAQATFTNAKQTLTVKQTFIESPTSTTTAASNPLSFYHENSLASDDVPICTIANGDVTFTNMQKVSGLSILTNTSNIVLTGVKASKMGKYFYRTPLVNYYLNNTKVKSETDLSNVKSGKDSKGFTNGELTFDNSFLFSENTYQNSLVIGMEANNINNVLSTKSVTSNINVIGDLPSYTLITSLSSTIGTLTANSTVAGYRILSPATVTNLCPALPDDTLPAAYNNATTLMDANYQRELIVSDGRFASTQSKYMDYSSYYGNENNYSTLATIPDKFVSFCWKLGQSTGSYSAIQFIIESIVTPTGAPGTGVLKVNNADIKMFYAIKDTINASDYSSSRINTGWIDANSTDNGSTMGTYYLAANYFGTRGGNAGTLIQGNTATINAFIPSLAPNNSTYIYLRIAVPTNTDIKFGKVSAKVI